MGRPTEFQSPRSTTVIFESSDLQKFKETCARQNQSMSDLIRAWAKDFVKQHEQNDQTKLDSSLKDAGFKAYPTVWDEKSFTLDNLDLYEPSEIQEMKQKIDRAQRVVSGKIEELKFFKK